MISSSRGGVGLKHITKGKFEAIQLPIPPLDEQKNIVEVINNLLAGCDRLKQKLETLIHLRKNMIQTIANELL